MLKKLLFTSSLFFAGILLLSAQCTPDGSATAPGIYPDTLHLPDAYATIPYFVTMTAVIPVDTLYMGIILNIDSIGVTGISGLPSGFTYTPNTVSGYWHGGTNGCILLSGTASHSQVGIYPITIDTKAYASLGGLTQQQTNPVKGYKIIIKDTVLGINENLAQGGISIINDLDDYSVLVKIHSAYNIEDASIIVNDITGRELMHLNNLNGNDFIVSKGNLSNGIYLVSFMSQEGILAKQKVVIR